MAPVTAVEVALLLGDPVGERHLDDARALAHLDDPRSQQPHQALAGEARPHPLTGVVPPEDLVGRSACSLTLLLSGGFATPCECSRWAVPPRPC
jgi:hypothetical protein